MANKIEKALKIQQKIEGLTPETELLLGLLPLVKMQSEWTALTKVKRHRYGTSGFQSHIFYYPSQLLVNIKDYYRRITHDT